MTTINNFIAIMINKSACFIIFLSLFAKTIFAQDLHFTNYETVAKPDFFEQFLGSEICEKASLVDLGALEQISITTKLSKKAVLRQSHYNPPIIENENLLLRLNGRAQLDFGKILKPENKYENEGFMGRRLWIEPIATINKKITLKSQFVFEGQRTNYQDLYTAYQPNKNLKIFVGQMFPNNGIDAMTSDLILSMMEFSSATTAFKGSRRLGTSIDPYFSNGALHFGYFKSSLNNSNYEDDSGGYHVRGHINLLANSQNFESLHIGFNTANQSPDRADKIMRFSSKGESAVLSKNLVDTKNITNVKRHYQNSLEFRYQKDRFTLTSEYNQNVIQRHELSELHFDGKYILASYFLTNNHFNYDNNLGFATAPKIEKMAIEIAGRISDLNLNDQEIRGGKMRSYSLGLNFYTTKNFKFMTDYTYNDVSKFTSNKNAQYVTFRAQFSF